MHPKITCKQGWLLRESQGIQKKESVFQLAASTAFFIKGKKRALSAQLYSLFTDVNSVFAV